MSFLSNVLDRKLRKGVLGVVLVGENATVVENAVTLLFVLIYATECGSQLDFILLVGKQHIFYFFLLLQL